MVIGDFYGGWVTSELEGPMKGMLPFSAPRSQRLANETKAARAPGDGEECIDRVESQVWHWCWLQSLNVKIVADFVESWSILGKQID